MAEPHNLSGNKNGGKKKISSVSGSVESELWTAPISAI